MSEISAKLRDIQFDYQATVMHLDNQTIKIDKFYQFAFRQNQLAYLH